MAATNKFERIATVEIARIAIIFVESQIRGITDLCKFVGVRLEFHLVAAVRPRAENERAFLLVEREIFDVDRARALVYRARDPHHVAVVVDQNIRLKLNLELSVGAACKMKQDLHSKDDVFRRFSSVL